MCLAPAIGSALPYTLPSCGPRAAGYDGCSPHQLAVLKTSSLHATNAFVAPSVYVLEAVDSEQLVSA